MVTHRWADPEIFKGRRGSLLSANLEDDDDIDNLCVAHALQQRDLMGRRSFITTTAAAVRQ
jgi:hypothetical protein